MPYQRRRTRRHRSRRIRRAVFVGPTVVGLACVLLVASSSLLAPGEVSDQQAAREAEPVSRVPSSSPVDAGDRVFYPYSVVPGGVQSREALVAAVADPVVAAHYARVDIAHVRVTTVPAPRRAYVSYRIGDRVFWTKHTVALRPGERILTDGANEIRGRCGNSISETPQAPTSPEEPELAEFDRAIAPGGLEAPPLLMASEPDARRRRVAGSPFSDSGLPLNGSQEPSLAGGAPAPGWLTAKNLRIGGLSADPSSDESLLEEPPDPRPGAPFPPETPAPLTPVPEPGSIILLGTGLGGCAVRAWRRRRREARQPRSVL